MDIRLQRILIPALIVLICFSILLVTRSLAFRLIMREKTGTMKLVQDLVINSLKGPSIFWCLAIGLYIGVDVSELNAKYVFYITKTIHALLIFSVTVAVSNMWGRIFGNYIQRSNLSIPETGLVRGVLKGTILTIGLLIILSVFGVSITPLITALGVGGLAAALALQDTLANLFSGMHILVEKSIRVGDYIKIETGQEGYVEDIMWRTTRIRTLSNNMVVIPNLKLGQSVVTNYHLPDKRIPVSITVKVIYSSDLNKIESILLNEAHNAIGNVPGLLAEPKPSVQLVTGFGESSLDFTLSCWVEQYTDQYLVQYELRKRIFERFQAEGIGTPFPHRVVYLKADKDTSPK
jgi:small-conductance mechanosensitive channel